MRDVLVIDDESDIRELIELSLLRMGLTCDTAGSVAEGKARLDAETYRLCLTDMRLPDGDGLELVLHIQRQCPQLPVAVISAHGSIDTAIRAMKLGAFDFVSKPVELAALREMVKHAMQLDGDGDKATATAAGGQGRQLIGDSQAMQQVRSQIEKLARNQAPVYIRGESGTGKEVIARQIHALGPRAKGPFVPVNCGAIPQELMESEFFGHKKGSFTGAVADKQGLFQAAHGGTLFLDEVGDLPLGMQVKLLRAIQERVVRPVGSHQEEPVDVRILSASHRDLATLVSQGEFRQDLFFRINVIMLAVPPLRERLEDIEPLSGFILARLAERNAMPVPTLSQAALDALRQYAFPGNVRELENLLERACALCEGEEIQPEDLNLEEHKAAAPFGTLPEAEAVMAASAAGASSTVLALEAELARAMPAGVLRSSRPSSRRLTQQQLETAAASLGLTASQLRFRLLRWRMSEVLP
ncbi:MAG: sigma-54-dependent Fis family transcriptional regulator [Rhodocyclaceae bacterium]|nr:sigma-54-dependent Fis family transcriptional regulator [Rhodocyclaceae bacterium]